MALPHFSMKLIATAPVAATKSCSGNVNTWTKGKNTLAWDMPDAALSLAAYIAIWIQRSSIDNTRMYPQIETPNVPATLPDDSFWTTVKHWTDAEINKNDLPKTWDDVDVPHSTFYYYRLIMHYSFSSASPPYTQVNWKAATIVQPFDLSICTVDSCTNPQQCPNDRLVWDAPALTVPFITGTSHVSGSPGTCCTPAGGCYKIDYSFPYTPPATSIQVWKGSSPSTLTYRTDIVPTYCAALTGGSWFDGDTTHGIYYKFVAVRANGSEIPSQTVFITY